MVTSSVEETERVLSQVTTLVFVLYSVIVLLNHAHTRTRLLRKLNINTREKVYVLTDTCTNTTQLFHCVYGIQHNHQLTNVCTYAHRKIC